MADILSVAKTKLASWLSEGYTHKGLDDLVASDDARIVEVVANHMLKARYEAHMMERDALEAAYRTAQARGCKLSGWKLRFLVYYFYGKNTGEW